MNDAPQKTSVSATPLRADLGDVRAFIAAERERIAGDASYTHSERLRLAMAFELMTCKRPTAQIKGLEVYERVETAHPGAPVVPYVSWQEQARQLQEERLAAFRRERESGGAG